MTDLSDKVDAVVATVGQTRAAVEKLIAEDKTVLGVLAQVRADLEALGANTAVLAKLDGVIADLNTTTAEATSESAAADAAVAPVE